MSSAKCFTFMSSFSSHDNLKRQATLCLPISHMGTPRHREVHNLPRVTQPRRGGDGLRTQAIWLTFIGSHLNTHVPVHTHTHTPPRILTRSHTLHPALTSVCFPFSYHLPRGRRQTEPSLETPSTRGIFVDCLHVQATNNVSIRTEVANSPPHPEFHFASPF